MIENLFKKISSLILAFISLILIILGLHSYFFLKKIDFNFLLITILFSGVCLTISLALLVDKIKIINKALDKKNYFANLLIGTCSIIISISGLYSICIEQPNSCNVLDIVGVSFFGIGGIFLLSRGVKIWSKR